MFPSLPLHTKPTTDSRFMASLVQEYHSDQSGPKFHHITTFSPEECKPQGNLLQHSPRHHHQWLWFRYWPPSSWSSTSITRISPLLLSPTISSVQCHSIFTEEPIPPSHHFASFRDLTERSRRTEKRAKMDVQIEFWNYETTDWNGKEENGAENVKCWGPV